MRNIRDSDRNETDFSIGQNDIANGLPVVLFVMRFQMTGWASGERSGSKIEKRASVRNLQGR
jgi:hypothetical protein